MWSEIHTLRMKENVNFLEAVPFPDIFCDIYDTEKSEIKLMQKFIGKNLKLWIIFWKWLQITMKNNEKSEFATLIVTFVRSTNVTNGSFMTLFHQNLTLNLTHTLIWSRNEGKVGKKGI